MRTLDIGVVDDHNLYVKGFALLLKNISEAYRINIVIESNSEKDFISKLSNAKPDLVFLDLNLENSDGLDLIRIIKQNDPSIKVIIVSMLKDAKLVRNAFKSGADGYLSKDTTVKDLKNAIEHVVDNNEIYFGEGIEAVSKKSTIVDRANESNLNRFNAKFKLTNRELEIMHMIIEGMTNKEIAQKVFIAEDTVKVHRKNMMKKKKKKNVVMLIKVAKDYNII